MIFLLKCPGQKYSNKTAPDKVLLFFAWFWDKVLYGLILKMKKKDEGFAVAFVEKIPRGNFFNGFGEPCSKGHKKLINFFHKT